MPANNNTGSTNGSDNQSGAQGSAHGSTTSNGNSTRGSTSGNGTTRTGHWPTIAVNTGSGFVDTGPADPDTLAYIVATQMAQNLSNRGQGSSDQGSRR
nr:uncharacterized protein CI109_007349 [Kwoniella shandongensis]KAA5524302.1 hypothetical protein CI109_007349 [Kwoniella shandongensis]